MKKKSYFIMANIPGYQTFFEKIYDLIINHKSSACLTLYEFVVRLYWEIGYYIVSYLQEDKERAPYDEEIISQLSLDLTKLGEKGFSKTNLKNMRTFYVIYPDMNLLRKEIIWTHYLCLMRISCSNSRRFYEEMIIKEKWSTRELEKQIQSSLYERVLTNPEKELEIIKTTKKQYLPRLNIEEYVKDPFVLDFLPFKENYPEQEKDLENAIMLDIEKFLLELGYGFTFAWRQKRIQIANTFYYVDLVFFHRGLKCLVLIDLKIKKFSHEDVGQMNLYLNYFAKNECYRGENKPIGIILCADKDNETVNYALGNINQRIFVTKYLTMLPSQEILQKRIIEKKQKYFENKVLHGKVEKSKHPRKDEIVNYGKQCIKITVGDYEKLINVSRSTAQRDLKRAVDEGWLKQHGQGRSCYYILDLE